MLFNSLDFAIFLPVVFILYWFVTNRNLKVQNVLIVISSYVFYGWWDWKFLGLVLFSTIVDFFIGIGLKKQQNKVRRKVLVWASILVNLGFLGFFKYFNFFLDNFLSAFIFLGYPLKVNSLNIILPVGISFYTFQTLSYTIDVYKRKLQPTTDFIAFSAFVSFFPQLVAGPIERATHLLPQFYNKRKFEYSKAKDGMHQILWGLFKKVVIADTCAEYANIIFNNSDDYSGSTLLLGGIFFAFQIYGDFSGYSDIAIGTSRLFGFDLMQNFNFPYFSRNIGEFWRKWHISLNTWFRDYLYFPLGGSRGGVWMKIRNTFIIFIVSGFWHGANWTFIAWGLLNALYFLPLLLTNNNRNHLDIVAKGKLIPSFKEIMQISATFGLTVLAWIFFRAEDIQHALSYLLNLFSTDLFSFPDIRQFRSFKAFFIIFMIFLLIEWFGRGGRYGLEKLVSKVLIVRWSFILILSLIVLQYMWNDNNEEFIYFQF